MTSAWSHDTARLTQPFSDCRVVLIVVSAIDHVRPIEPGTLITGNSGLRLDPRKDCSQLVGSARRQQQLRTRRGVERKRSVFGIASWRIVLGGTRFPWKNTHRMSKSTTRFVKIGDLLQARTRANARRRSPDVRAHYTCVTAYTHRKRRPVPELPERVLYFVSDPSFRFSTRKPSVFLSAGTREFDLWRRTDWGRSSR